LTGGDLGDGERREEMAGQICRLQGRPEMKGRSSAGGDSLGDLGRWMGDGGRRLRGGMERTRTRTRTGGTTRLGRSRGCSRTGGTGTRRHAMARGRDGTRTSRWVGKCGWRSDPATSGGGGGMGRGDWRGGANIWGGRAGRRDGGVHTSIIADSGDPSVGCTDTPLSPYMEPCFLAGSTKSLCAPFPFLGGCPTLQKPLNHPRSRLANPPSQCSIAPSPTQPDNPARLCHGHLRARSPPP